MKGKGSALLGAWKVMAVMGGITLLTGCRDWFQKEPPPPPVVELMNPEGLVVEPGQEQLIKDYYAAVNKKDPQAACQLRRECSETDQDSIRTNFGVTLSRITVLRTAAEEAVFMTEGLEGHSDGSQSAWTHYLTLSPREGGWQISALSYTPPPPPAPPEPGPEEVVRKMYEALNAKDESAYCSLFLECSDQKKQPLARNAGVVLEKASLVNDTGDSAVVFIESEESFADGSKARWRQHWYLKKTEAGWKIDTTDNVELIEISPQGETTNLDPEKVMHKYYKALDDNEVETACSLRKSCSPQNKRNIIQHKPITLIRASLVRSDSRSATVHTESVEINNDGSRWRWHQDWFLEKRGGQWLIVDTGNAVFQKE